MSELASSSSALITTATGLNDLVAHMRQSGRFAFDTEFVSEETYEPVLGLVQVATRERIAAIDPLAVSGLGPLWEVVTDSAVEVVMHAGGKTCGSVLGAPAGFRSGWSMCRSPRAWSVTAIRSR